MSSHRRRRFSSAALATVGALGIASLTVWAQKPVAPPAAVAIARDHVLGPQGVLSAAVRDAAIVRTKGAGGASDPASAATPSGTALGIINLQFDSAASCAKFAAAAPTNTVFARFDKYCDVYVADDQADAISKAVQSAGGLVRIERVGGAIAPPPPARGPQKPGRGTADTVVRGGVAGMTGKGVTIAVVDSGVDFRHPDFIRMENGKPVSRLLYLWDTTASDFDEGKGGTKAPVLFPNGSSVGTVFTQEQLTADLRAATSTIGDRDVNGHGTSCAGIAAGNGSALGGRYMGVAPDADIIAVRIGNSTGGGLRNAYLLNAICAWLDQVSGKKPLVVSCSFGGHFGTHDGRSIQEQELSARFAPSTVGRAICIAAGNEGGDPIHAQVTLGGSDSQGKLSWKAESDATVTLLFDTDDVSDIRFRPAAGTKLGELSAEVNPDTKQMSVPVNGLTGAGGVSLFSASGKKIVCDAYISGGEFDASCVSMSKVIGRPGTTPNAITVGSYDWNDLFEMEGKMMVIGFKSGPMTIGGLSSYSSVGPSRDPSVVKPDLVSPGQWWQGAAPLNKTSNPNRDTSKKYQLFNGTSAATPYTSGIVALMFQKKPTLTAGEVKDLLHKNARPDSYTGASLPSPKWGYGKLNIDAVKAILAAIK